MNRYFFDAAFGRLACFGLATSLALAVFAHNANAQEAETVSRVPAEGIAILDCKPSAPAPDDSCVLRVPPDHLRARLRSQKVGDEDADFDFASTTDDRLGTGVAISETVILIDLTPGPGGQRRGTFAQEKQLIRQFVETLPNEGRTAIYGFNESLTRLLDFTTDQQSILEAIDDLALSGTNTRISTYTKDVVDILAARNRGILKRVFLISDGEEEGTGDIAGVTEAAITADVSISAIGTFWRAVGSAEIGTGRDFLRALTEPTLGSSVELLLQRPAESRDKLAAFAEGVSASIRDSGLILPDGPIRPADIIVTLKVPERGVPGSYRDEEIRVRFTPMADAEPESTADEETPAADQTAEPKMIFGYPALWVYIGAAALALLVLLLLFALLRGRRGEHEGAEQDGISGFPDDFDGFDTGATNNEATRVVPPAPAPEPRATAYLVDTKTNRRLPIATARVSIGRGTANSMIIDHDSISRIHAEILRNRDGGYTLSDSDSLNGTFINGKKIKGASPVQPGDDIKLGEVEMRLVLA